MELYTGNSNYHQTIDVYEGLLILFPLIYELSDLKLNLNLKNLTPYFTILIALLLVSKIPTLSFKKISISSKTTVFASNNIFDPLDFTLFFKICRFVSILAQCCSFTFLPLFPISSIDIDKTFREQFNLLRVVDNKRYPAFFYFKNQKYVIKIEKT